MYGNDAKDKIKQIWLVSFIFFNLVVGRLCEKPTSVTTVNK